MQLYRARPTDGVAWVTGASSGIGRQLSLDLAARGYTVAASARGSDELEKVAAEATGSAGRIVPISVDITDEQACEDAVERIEREIGPIVLAILNAGSYRPARGEQLDFGDFKATFNLNVLGSMACLIAATKRMRHRGRGQIALVGSITSYLGLPAAASYGASKSALNFIAQSLKYDYDKMNIRIQIINPGFVETPLTEKNDFFMPGLMPVAKASRRIIEGLERGGFEVAFPRRLAWAMWLVRSFPHRVRHAFVRWFTGWGKRPLKP